MTELIEKNKSSAAKLLNRKAPSDYISEWTEILMKEKESKDEKAAKETSVLIFRLYDEWLALPVYVFREVVEYRTIHRIPHRTNPILLGTVNMRGQLRLCISLHHLLQIEPSGDWVIAEELMKHDLMLLIEKDNERWVFPSDDIFGILLCDYNNLQNVPVTVAKSTANYLRGIFEHQNKQIGILDEELVFFSLRRSIL